LLLDTKNVRKIWNCSCAHLMCIKSSTVPRINIYSVRVPVSTCKTCLYCPSMCPHGFRLQSIFVNNFRCVSLCAPIHCSSGWFIPMSTFERIDTRYNTILCSAIYRVVRSECSIIIIIIIKTIIARNDNNNNDNSVYSCVHVGNRTTVTA